MRVFYSGSLPVVFVPGYTMSHICCCWGGFLAGGRDGGPVLRFSGHSGWSP